jgi:uncharacterized membrane protein YgcG
MPRFGMKRLVRRLPAALALVAIATILLVLVLVRPAAALTLPPSQAGVAVYDLAHAWQPGTIAQAQSIATSIRLRTQAEIAVVSIPTGLSDVSTTTAQADALLIMQTWGVGRPGVDVGLVVLFDLDTTLRHGQIYLYTGKGFRDLYLSDDEARSIVDDVMLPTAKSGDLDGALLQGLALVDHVTQSGGNPDRAGTALLHALVGAVIVGGAVLVLALFMRTWWLRGRDARIPTIDDSVLLPAPPPGLTPAMATVLRRDQVDHESFTSALVDLGHRGLLTFEEGGLIKKHVSLLVPMTPLDDAGSSDARRRPLGSAEATLLDGVEVAATGGVLSSAELKKGTGKKLYDAFKKSIGEAALASGWFRDDPTKIVGRWTGIGIGLAVVAIALAFFLVVDRSNSSNLVLPGKAYIGWPLVVAFVIGAAIAVLSRYLAARTTDGAQTLAMALAYRNTLRYEIARADTIDHAVAKTSTRLPWITTPDELTVWAVALGLKNEVDGLIKQTFEASQAAGSPIWAPVWFSGGGGLGDVASVDNLTSMIGSISTTAASSSGSGFSGGGGGGGGGGAGGGF